MVVSPSLRPRRKVLQLLLLVAALCQWAGAALVQGSQCDALNNTFWPPQGGAVTTYVKIGLPQTISGKWAVYGLNMCGAATLWLEALVASPPGGFHVGATTQPARANNTVGFEVFVEDATSTLGGETRAATALMARGVHVIIAPYSSTLTPGVALVAQQVPVVSWGAASESVFRCPTDVRNLASFPPCAIVGRPRFRNLFSVLSPGPTYFVSITELARTYNVRQVGTVYENTAATRSYALGAMNRAYELGMNNSVEIEVVVDPAVLNPVVTNTATLGKADIQKTVTAKDNAAAMHTVARLLRDLKEDIGIHPELVVGGTYYDPCVALVRALIAEGWYPKALAVTSCAGDPRMIDELGENVRWIIGPTQWDKRMVGPEFDESALHFPLFKSNAGVPAPAVFNEMWRVRFGSEPNYQAAGSMAAMVMVGAALTHVVPGTVIDAAAISAQLGEVYCNSFYGALGTNKWGMNDRRAMSVYQYDAQAAVQLVAPLSAATARVIYPTPALDANDRNAPCGPGNKVLGDNRMCSSSERAAARAGEGAATNNTSATWRLLGDQWCATQCESCPSGTYSNDPTGTTSCTPCPANTVASLPGSTECTLCGSGKTHNTAHTACVDCAPGSAREADGPGCEPCGPGTFASMFGTSSCLSCDFDAGGYALTSNNTGCVACPANTVRVLGSPGIAVSECLCRQGYYQPMLKPNGAACISCPAEGTCDGAMVRSTPMQSSITTAATPSAPGPDAPPPLVPGNASAGGAPGTVNAGGTPGTAAAAETRTNFVNAPPYPRANHFAFREDLLSGAANTTDFTPILWPCAAGRCLGGPDFQCHDAWTGAMCSSCSSGHFSVGIECLRCLDNGGPVDVATFVFSAGAIITLWVGMNTVVAGGYDTFDITLIFLQVLSTVQSFSLKWPTSLNLLSQAAALVNFDLDFIAPNCFMEWRYVHRATLTLTLPLVLVLASAVASAWKTYLLLREQTGAHQTLAFSAEVLWHGLAHPAQFLLCGKVHDCGRLMLNHDRRKRLVSYIDNLVSKLLSFLVVVYNNLCLKTFGSFHCVNRGPGNGSYLYQEPNISCWDDPEHHYLLILSALGMVGYVVAIPAGIGLVLHQARRTNSLYKPEVINRLGFLYRRYETNRHLWEVTFLCRRAVVTIVYVFYGSSQPYIAMLWVMGALGVNLTISAGYMPFKDYTIDLIDIFAILCIMLYLLAGVVADAVPKHSNNLGILLNLIVWGQVLYCLVETVRETNEKRKTALYAKKIQTMMLKVRKMGRANEEQLDSKDPALGPNLVKGKAVWTHQLACRSILKAFRGLEEDGFTTVTLVQISEWLKNGGERYVHPEHPVFYSLRQVIGITDTENLPVESCILALDGELKQVSVLEGMFEEKTQDGRDMAGELSKTLRPDLLRALVDNLAKGGDASVATYSRFITLAGSMQTVLGDNCAVGEYSHYPEAILLKKLARAIPGLVDYAVTCTETEAAALQTTFTGLCRLAIQRGTVGFLAPLCVEEDHGPMLYWLMLADKYDRQLLRVFLEEVELETLHSENQRAVYSKRNHECDGDYDMPDPGPPSMTAFYDLAGHLKHERGRGGGHGQEQSRVRSRELEEGRPGSSTQQGEDRKRSRQSLKDGCGGGAEASAPTSPVTIASRVNLALGTSMIFGKRVPAMRGAGHAQGAMFRSTGFRIFKSSHVCAGEGTQSARRFEHGLGFVDFDEIEGGGQGGEGGQAGGSIERGLKGGRLDSFPISFK